MTMQHHGREVRPRPWATRPVGRLRRPLHVVRRNWLVTRASWWPALSGVFEPFIYLTSIGLGVSVLVGDVDVDGRTFSYTEFVAPAMLASAAMTGALAETAYNIFAKFHWDKTYQGMTATPLTPSDIAIGELLYAQLRGSINSAVFLVAMAVLGLIGSWWAVLALPAVILIGLAFSAVGLVAVSHMTTWEHFDLVYLGQIVLFLFSATFFPLDVYPEALQWIARLSPLFHGAALCRDLVLGTVGWADLGHAAVLVVMAAVGLRVAMRRFDRLLHQ